MKEDNGKLQLSERNFLLKKSFDRWIKENEEELLLLHLRNNIQQQTPFFSLLHQTSQSLNAVAKTGEAFATSLLHLPHTVSNIVAIQEEFMQLFEEQRNAMQELSASTFKVEMFMNEILESLDESVKLTVETNDATEALKESTFQARAIIEESMKDSQSVSQANLNIQSEVLAMQTIIDKVSEQANQIKKIADQTNMLALNASIEAARAGDQGRGFSVVADGVSNLAEQSTKTVSIIAQSLEEIRRRFHILTASVSSQIEKVNTVLDTMNFVHGAMDNSVSAADFTLNHMGSLKVHYSKATEQLTQIGVAMRDLTDDTGILSEKNEKMAERTEHVKAEAAHIYELINSFVNKITDQNPVWLLGFIKQRKQDHMDWVVLVEKAISVNRIDLLPELEPTRCKLGLWYYSTEVKNQIQATIHNKMEEPHNLLHSSGKAIKAMMLSGDTVNIPKELEKLKEYSRQTVEVFHEYESYLEKMAVSQLKSSV